MSSLLLLDYNYIIIGLETCPTSGLVHLQGYINLIKTVKLGGMKKIHQKAHWEAALGSDIDNQRYCSKEEVLFESGTPVLPGSHKRRHERLYEEDPDTLRLDNPSIFVRIQSDKLNSEWKTVCEEGFPYDLYRWQLELLDILAQPADDRTICWVYGADGNDGKTKFSKHLAGKEDWMRIPGGKNADMLYLYMMKPTRNLVLDVPRCHSDFLNYAVLEQIKDRMITSTKYEPAQVTLKENVHVVVMANVMPCVEGYCKDTGKDSHMCKLSKDRIKLIIC